MADLALTTIVDDSTLREMRSRFGGVPGDLVADVAAGLRDELETASPVGETGELASSWHVEKRSETEAVVASGVHYAHMVAGGTSAHGPRDSGWRSRLLFTIAGSTVWAAWVSGTPARPFHDDAKHATEAQLPGMLADVMARHDMGG